MPPPRLSQIAADQRTARVGCVAPIGGKVKQLEQTPTESGSGGAKMLPRRWAVECFFAWINRNRRLAKDFEDTASATAFLYIASILKMTRHISMLDS